MFRLITDFLKYLEFKRGASEKTIQNYDHYLKRFLSFAGDIHPSEINLPLIRRYRLYLSHWRNPQSKKPLKKLTQNYHLIAFRSLLRYLARRDIKTLSAEKIELGKTEASPIKILNQEALVKLLATPNITSKQGLRDRALLETLFSTGIKVSELASLNYSTINFNKKEFSIFGKKGQKRTVFLSDAAVSWLDRYLKKRKDTFKPLFIRFAGRVDAKDDGEGMRLTPRSIQRIVEKYVKKAGLSVKATPHTLRHSFAKDLVKSGVSLRSVQEILGHSNISTTQVYTQILKPPLNNRFSQ
ncbi:tyrosine-type recombinase/integrase [Patescibacteria group bacterium]|nr:tyrosine-type recombinase/integrase [Patescibacteria group bacterium]